MAGSYLKWKQAMEDIMVACIFLSPSKILPFFFFSHTVATAVLHAKEVGRQLFHMSLLGACKSFALQLVKDCLEHRISWGVCGILKKSISHILFWLLALCCALWFPVIFFYQPFLSTQVFSVPYPASSEFSGHVYMTLKVECILPQTLP